MLNISNHGCWAIARIEVILLDTRVASNSEKGGSGSVVANSGNAISRGYSFVGNSLCTNIPGAGLPAVTIISSERSGDQCDTYPSVYCTMRPFFDQANQQGPGSRCSFWLRTRITQGLSPA